MCQGIGYEIWSKKEFTFMKEYIEKISFKKPQKTINQEKAEKNSNHSDYNNVIHDLSTNLDEVYKLIQSTKSTNKKGLNTATLDEKRMDEQLEEPQSSTLFELQILQNTKEEILWALPEDYQ